MAENLASELTQQAHDVNTTSPQRRSSTLSRRCINVMCALGSPLNYCDPVCVYRNSDQIVPHPTPTPIQIKPVSACVKFSFRTHVLCYCTCVHSNKVTTFSLSIPQLAFYLNPVHYFDLYVYRDTVQRSPPPPPPTHTHGTNKARPRLQSGFL